jgi:mannosyltransferase
MARYWPLAVATIVGAALRFNGLAANSLWVDEIATLSVAAHSSADILRISSSANFVPPLYFLLVHGALQVFGESEVALRLPSVITGICTIPVVWLLTEQIAMSRSTANIAGVLLAVNPLHLWYSQEARPYAVLLFFGCCALLSLQRALRTGSLRHWMAFSACSALTILTHTTGLIFGVIAWTWALSSSDRRRVVRPLLASSLAVGLVCAPFFLAIARELAATGTFHSPPRSLTGWEVPYTLLTYVTGFSFGPAPRDIQNLGALAAVRSHLLQSAIAGAALIGALIGPWLKRRAIMAPFFVLLAIPLAGIFVLSALSGKAYNVRYTLPALIGFLGIVSVALHTLRPRLRAVVLTVLVGLGLWADAQWFWSSDYWKEDSRAAVAWLRDRLPPGATVAVAPSYGIQPLAYYSRKAGAELRFLPIPPGVGLPDGSMPDALVLTRLHHVPNWRELKAGFVGLIGVRVLEGHVAGYEMLARPLLQHRIGTQRLRPLAHDARRITP